MPLSGDPVRIVILLAAPFVLMVGRWLQRRDIRERVEATGGRVIAIEERTAFFARRFEVTYEDAAGHLREVTAEKSFLRFNWVNDRVVHPADQPCRLCR